MNRNGKRAKTRRTTDEKQAEASLTETGRKSRKKGNRKPTQPKENESVVQKEARRNRDKTTVTIKRLKGNVRSIREQSIVCKTDREGGNETIGSGSDIGCSIYSQKTFSACKKMKNDSKTGKAS